MLYELIKREITEEKDKYGKPYNTSFNEKHYYDLVEKIHDFAIKSNLKYAICGAMALNLFYQKTRKTLNDLEIHIEKKDIDKWLIFFESNIDGVVFQDLPSLKWTIAMNHILTGRINGSPIRIEFETNTPFKRLKINKFKNINLSISYTIRVKNLWDRQKDKQDRAYYKYHLYHFIENGMIQYLRPLYFIIKRNTLLKRILKY